jgi:DNA-binding Lrp family transcriptional regulator
MRIPKFSEEEKILLMALQYNFPLSEEPYYDLADITGLEADFVFRRTREFLKDGVIKRIGAQLNYKAFKQTGFAALVGARVDDLERAVEIINSYNPKHNFLRDDERYNVWFTIKAATPTDLRMLAKEIAERCSIRDYVFLPSKRVYKMDVKYDLFAGVSYSEAGLESFSVPDAEEIVNPKLLFELERNFRVEGRPFRAMAKKFGLGEGELISLVEELIELRVIRGFYGVLRERKIGFMENAMNMVETDKPSKVALRLLKEFPEITHLIEREMENWRFPLYFMVHATNRKPIEQLKEKVLEVPGVKSVKTLYSSADLKSGAFGQFG